MCTLGHKASGDEDVHMLGDGLPTHREASGEGRQGTLALVTKTTKDEAAGRIGNGCEDIGHTRNMQLNSCMSRFEVPRCFQVLASLMIAAR